MWDEIKIKAAAYLGAAVAWSMEILASGSFARANQVATEKYRTMSKGDEKSQDVFSDNSTTSTGPKVDGFVDHKPKYSRENVLQELAKANNKAQQNFDKAKDKALLTSVSALKRGDAIPYHDVLLLSGELTLEGWKEMSTYAGRASKKGTEDFPTEQQTKGFIASVEDYLSTRPKKEGFEIESFRIKNSTHELTYKKDGGDFKEQGVPIEIEGRKK